MYTQIDTDRYVQQQQDGTATYLLRSGDRFLELHVDDDKATLHEYTDMGPLAQAAHQRTAIREDLARADASAAWAALGKAAG